MLLLVVQIGESLEFARRLAIPENSFGALVYRRGAVFESTGASTLSTMCVLVRSKVLRRHARRGNSTGIYSFIKQAQIFNLVLHGVIFSEAGLLQQRIVVLPLLAASMSSTVCSINIIGRVRVTVIAGARRVSRTTMIRVIVRIIASSRALRSVAATGTSLVSACLAAQQEHLFMVEL